MSQNRVQLTSSNRGRPGRRSLASLAAVLAALPVLAALAASASGGVAGESRASTQVLGLDGVYRDNQFQIYGFKLDKRGRFTAIKIPGGRTESFATDIDDRGRIIGIDR